MLRFSTPYCCTRQTSPAKVETATGLLFIDGGSNGGKPNFAEAEDLAQEVFLRVYRSRTTYQPSARVTTWIYRIASNLVLNRIRDTGRGRAFERLDACRPGRRELQVPDRCR